MLFFFLMIRRPPRFTRTVPLLPSTTLFRSSVGDHITDDVCTPISGPAGNADIDLHHYWRDIIYRGIRAIRRGGTARCVSDRNADIAVDGIDGKIGRAHV